MKYLIYLVLSSIIFSCTGSKNSVPKWEEIIYHYQTGSIPPPYFYEYDIVIKNNGEGRLNYMPDYSNDTSKSWGYDFKIDTGSLKELTNELKKTKIMKEKIEEVQPDKIPIGGSLQNITVSYITDKEISRVAVPYFPKSKTKADELDRLYESLKALVSKEIWNDIEIRKNDYIEKNKK